jgi:hypothetical protein
VTYAVNNLHARIGRASEKFERAKTPLGALRACDEMEEIIKDFKATIKELVV